MAYCLPFSWSQFRWLSEEVLENINKLYISSILSQSALSSYFVYPLVSSLFVLLPFYSLLSPSSILSPLLSLILPFTYFLSPLPHFLLSLLFHYYLSSPLFSILSSLSTFHSHLTPLFYSPNSVSLSYLLSLSLLSSIIFHISYSISPIPPSLTCIAV